jgi:hypothetical protein
MQKTLDKVIVQILQSSKKPLSVNQITELISKEKLWFRPSDNKLPIASQVSARINNKKKYFDIAEGLVTLKTENEYLLKNNVLLVNITWNPFGWRNNSYINPRAGHHYAKGNVGGESLNFNFNKKNVDNTELIHGYVQCVTLPDFEPVC